MLNKILNKISHIWIHDKTNPSAILNDLGTFRLINQASQLTVSGFICLVLGCITCICFGNSIDAVLNSLKQIVWWPLLERLIEYR